MRALIRKRGQMNRIRCGAILAGLAALLAASSARAQETTGGVTGRVTDAQSGAAIGGVTVIAQGPQGEDATITDDQGQYYFTNLRVGTYVIRFYVANTSAQTEMNGVVVVAEKTVRVNTKVAGTAQAAAQQTYVITGKAPSIDIGSTRVGATFDDKYMLNLPSGRTYGDIIQKAPGAFIDPSGNVSIGGATGLENIYTVNGMNVTGMEMGNLESGAASLSGGTNLPLEFLSQIDVSAGGYQAEFGGAMGGVISTVLKSGSNELHGSVFSLWAPFWLSDEPKVIGTNGGALGSVRKPDFDTSIGAEVGGPIIKDKLFFWIGVAPRIQNTHVFRLTYAQKELVDASGNAILDMNGNPQAQLDANGNPVVKELTDWRARINESRKVWSYAATMDWIPRPEHKLTLSLMGTPSFNQQMRSFSHIEAIADPSWSQESLTKSNTDATLHWTSKLFDRRWQIDALAGLHNEYFYDRSPFGALNNLNQLEIYGANLWDLEHAPGCEPTASGFQPCPVNPDYHRGGFGLVKKFTGNRWTAELKSTNLVEAGGHHEIKYGWHLEYATFDQDRWYSGPPGARGLVNLFPAGTPANYSTQTFFTLPQGTYPADFGTMHPLTDVLYPPYYQDHLVANVKSISNAFFLQDSYSPAPLRNLTFNVGARLELQKMYDFRGASFLDASNLGPRLGAVYDPFNDGRSKISVSYGRYFEAIPLSLAARYFGGEGFLIRGNAPLGQCSNPNSLTWTGNGEFRNCNLPGAGSFNDQAGVQSTLQNNGSDYPVQSHLKGQYHNEVVATLERELIDDLTVRVDYVHRWLGNVIEDGAGTTGSFVLANPGNVPPEALADAHRDVVNAMAADAANSTANTQSVLANAQAKEQTLKDLASAPKPERTYDAISLSVNRRFSKSWFARASYTYSRLVGNYEGLYQLEQDYFAPNGNNAYDFPDLYANQRGRLPNDRPHLGRVDGYYTHDVGGGRIVFGLSFLGQSGMPRNYISALLPGYPLTQLLPRGSAGRTPAVTQFDGHIAYGYQLSAKTNLEAFIDLFNIFNQQAAVLLDDNYTFDAAAPIVNGTTQDLKFAKNVNGQPVTKNQNFGNALAYQAPFSGRLGLRLNF
jgi:Carboxypeptidase regulatory-like domain